MYRASFRDREGRTVVVMRPAKQARSPFYKVLSLSVFSFRKPLLSVSFVQNSSVYCFQISEYIIPWRTYTVPCILFGECNPQPAWRSRENDLADRLHRMDNGKCCAHKDCPRNCKHPAKSLPWEADHCISIQSPKSIRSVLEGKVCRSSPVFGFLGNNLKQTTCTIKRTTHRR